MARSISDITNALIKAGWVSQYARCWGVPIDFINRPWKAYEKCNICITVYNELNVQICSRSNRNFNYIVAWDDIAELALNKEFEREGQFIADYNRLEIKQLLEHM